MALRELLLEPVLECFHDRTTRVLMVGQAFRGLERLETCLFVMITYLREGFEDPGTCLRKRLLQLAARATPMGQTMTANERRVLGCIPHQRL
jgi:hypothetical protein